MVLKAHLCERKLSDIHRFWEQTGNFYARMGNDNITVSVCIGLSVMPAVSSLFRHDGIRFGASRMDSEQLYSLWKLLHRLP
ncbi:MAG: hypothetical protein R2788_01295 [Saprospiraceae bacterium]